MMPLSIRHRSGTAYAVLGVASLILEQTEQTAPGLQRQEITSFCLNSWNLHLRIGMRSFCVSQQTLR